MMSRHTFKADNPQQICTVGWDRGLKTFFAQVEDTEINRQAEEAEDRMVAAYERSRFPDRADVEASRREAIVFWVGAERASAVPTVEALAALLAPFARLSPELREILREDQAREESAPRTLHQIGMLNFVSQREPERVKEKA